MIEIKDKKNCCGCGACLNICPKNCISMKEDKEGFKYPHIDQEICSDCGLCENVCHYINEVNDHNKSDKFYAAFTKNKEILKDSSSGGIFWELVERVIAHKGVVYGAVLSEQFFVKHMRSTTLEEAAIMRKSKYLQSSTMMTYKQAKEDLKNGNFVMFSGTPCQIAGLKSYLQEDYENLLTVDVVCHGVPSKKLFDSYISELNAAEHDEAVEMTWRDKRCGWGPNRISIQFASGKEVVTTSQENKFQKGFLDNFYLRPSCYSCKYAKLPRIADISLADFWGYTGALTHFNQNTGISIVILSSPKGEEVFDHIKSNLNYESVEEAIVKDKSRHVYLPPMCNKKRDKVFESFEKQGSFDLLFQRYIKENYYKKLINRLKWKLSNIRKKLMSKC